MTPTITLLADIKEALAPLSVAVYRSDQMKRDANNAIISPDEDKYFVLFFLVGTPTDAWQRLQRDAIRLSAWAQDSNAALKLQSDAEPLLQAMNVELGRITYDGYSSPYHGWTREIFMHE
jgi:hypothetical protein